MWLSSLGSPFALLPGACALSASNFFLFACSKGFVLYGLYCEWNGWFSLRLVLSATLSSYIIKVSICPPFVLVWSFFMLKRISMLDLMSLISFVVATWLRSLRSVINFSSVKSWIYKVVKVKRVSVSTSLNTAGLAHSRGDLLQLVSVLSRQERGTRADV